MALVSFACSEEKVEARKLKKQGDKVKAVQDYKYEQLAMEI